MVIANSHGSWVTRIRGVYWAVHFGLLGDLCYPSQSGRDEQDYVADFNRLIVVAEAKIHGKEIDLEMLEAEGNDVGFMIRPKNRQERRSANRKSLQQSSILKSLATLGKYDGIPMLVKSILDGFVLGSFGKGGALEAKHPHKPPPSMPSITFSEPSLLAEIDNVFSCIKSFPKGTSYGRDAGRCLPILVEFVTSAPLTPLLKPDYKIRPIVVGTIWRRLVSKASRLYIGDTHIWSATGVQQGDPLGPPLFALILHPLLHKIKDSCKLLVHAWYLNDGTVIGDSEEVAKVLDIIKASGPEAVIGVKLLGGAVSRDVDFISGLAMRRAANVVDLMSLLPHLHDQPFFKDLQWRLASLPIRFGDLGLGLYLEELVSSYAFVASRAQSWVLQDHILRNSGICGMDDDYVSALACLCDTIPSFDFSSFTNKDIVPSKAQQTLENVLFSEMVRDVEVHFDITIRQKAVFKCLRAPHAKDFLLAILIDGLGQHMSPLEYRTILKYRLIIPLFPVDAICHVCRKACLDSFKEHAVHYKELPRFKHRHDMVKDVLFDICRHVGISSKNKAPVNFLTNPSDRRSTLKPADVLVFRWVGEKHTCVDLTRFSPLVGLSGRGFTAVRATLKAASCKVTKHENACTENQHVFIPFAVDTCGFLAAEAVELLSRVQRVMHNNVMKPRFMNVVFKCIGYAIQKGLAAQLVARLPSTTM
uniref:Putative reverse transcriptase domain-containing protein n=1 Tax=Tanacetum cinerariifolium TaxID=118510 RepID=A0A6L2KTP4_TANCI|nr:putative reverse transcriptase domain-containing protein [Tanacetum cinerariifolium]